MHPLNINIQLKATWCNEWPDLSIELNNHIYFQGKIENDQVIDFDAPGLPVNTLIIRHYNKKFGQNGQWDTVSEYGKILHDRAIELQSIKLNGVDIYKYFITACPFITEHNEKCFTNFYGFNGQAALQFECPVYNWIICNIVKPKAVTPATLNIETSSDNLFDYKRDLVEIEEIENILNQNAHLFSKSSPIRNI